MECTAGGAVQHVGWNSGLAGWRGDCRRAGYDGICRERLVSGRMVRETDFRAVARLERAVGGDAAGAVESGDEAVAAAGIRGADDPVSD